MPTKAEQRLLAKYGTAVPEEILKQKRGDQVKNTPVANKAMLVEMSADQCRAKCAAIGIEYLEGYEKRVIRYTLSDETVDRDGDIIIQDGCELENFKLNPVGLLFHDGRDFPIGNFLDVYVEGKELKGDLLFVDERVDPTGRADRAFRFAKSRIMRAGSIGFRGKEVKFPSQEERRILGMKDYGVIFTRWELLEFSPCSVPSNPHALADALRKGLLEPEDLEFIESPEDEVLDMKKEELEAIIDASLKKGMADLKKDVTPVSLEGLKAAYAEMERCMAAVKATIDATEETDEAKASREKAEKEAQEKAASDALEKELVEMLRETSAAIKA
jgi:hypothetical protein